MTTVVSGLRAGHGADPRALAVVRTRLSWFAESDGRGSEQAVYEIVPSGPDTAPETDAGAEVTT